MQRRIAEELIDCKDHIQQQFIEQMLKSRQIETFQPAQLVHKAVIRDLDAEHGQLKVKLSQLQEERNMLQDDNQSLVKQHEQQMKDLREELTSKLNTTKQEVCSLQELATKNEQGLESAERHICSLKNAQGRLQKDLDANKAKLKERSEFLSSVQEELERQRQDYEARLNKAKEMEKEALEGLKKDLEQKWEIIAKDENAKLREKLERQHEEDKCAALVQLSQQQDQGNSQIKVEDLLNQVPHISNTKHDEHEAANQALQEAHEEESQ